MKSPLPDPFHVPAPGTESRIRGPRPKLLLPLAIADIFSSLLYMAFHPDIWSIAGTMLGLGLLYCLWLGQNWARWLYLLLTPLGVFFYFFPTEPIGAAEQILNTVTLPLAFVWMWLLTRPEMIRFTKGQPVS